MVDTARTLSALQTLLADNVDGDIGAQDIREFLVSVYPQWQSWSPTLKGSVSDPSVGDGTENAAYMQLGTGSASLVICRYYLEFGSTTTAGSGNWRIDGPVTPKSIDAGEAGFGSVQVFDSNTGNYYHGSIRYLASPQDFDFFVDVGQVAHNSPITWASGDRFSAQWMYEVA